MADNQAAEYAAFIKMRLQNAVHILKKQVAATAHAAGFRFRLHGQVSAAVVRQAKRTAPDLRLAGGKLPGRPDLVFDPMAGGAPGDMMDRVLARIAGRYDMSTAAIVALTMEYPWSPAAN